MYREYEWQDIFNSCRLGDASQLSESGMPSSVYLQNGAALEDSLQPSTHDRGTQVVFKHKQIIAQY